MTRQHDPIISLRDIFAILRRNRRAIVVSAIGFGLFTSAWTLTEPVRFNAEGSFREKAMSRGGISSGLGAALLGKMDSGSKETEATTTLKSHRILNEVAKELSLQASVSEKKKTKNYGTYLPRILKNLKATYYQYVSYPYPIYEDPTPPAIQLADVQYDAEIPYKGLSVTFVDDDSFLLKDKGSTIRAKIGDTVTTDTFSFRVKKQDNSSLAKRSFNISLSSLASVTKSLYGELKIKADRDDKSLINITYRNVDRQKAATVINTLMEVYLRFLKSEQQRVAQSQLDYLSQRKGEMNETLKKMIQKHASKVSADLIALGFPNVDSAVSFLSENQAKLQQRLQSIDLEAKMLLKAKETGYSHFDNMTPYGDPGIINGILHEIRQLRRQSDNIQLTLQERNQEELSSFHEFIEELETIRKNAADAKRMLASLQDDVFSEEENSLAKSSKYFVKGWLDQLRNANHGDERNSVKKQFTQYLQQMVRLFDMHAEIIQERLANRQNPHIEFEGIELASSRELYVGYSKQIQELEGLTLQHHYIIDNIQDPEFEVGSLGTVLSDSVSQQMIQQASQLSLQLKDYNNRSQQEQQRIKEEIKVKKGFLTSHLKHASRLLVLRQKLLKDKVRSLQETTLALIQQQITLLETQLSEYINNRLLDLHHESEVIAQHQVDLNSKMADLPMKWSDEKMIHKEMELSKSIAGEVSHMIETKNLASNLEVNRSAPVDFAVPPLKPNSPRLPLFLMVGLFMGTFFSVSYLLCRTLLEGVPVSRENLTLSGYRFAGKLSHLVNSSLLDEDLETLRHIIASIPTGKETILAIEGKGPQYARQLVKLYVEQGRNVLLLPLTFNESNSEGGLLHYLNGTVDTPETVTEDGYTKVLTGGISRYGAEKTATERFRTLLEEYRSTYDIVIAYTRTAPLTGEASELRVHFDHAVVTLHDEVLQDLPSPKEMENVTFILG